LSLRHRHLLCSELLEPLRADVSERGVQPPAVVEAFQVLEHGAPRGSPAREAARMDEFNLQRRDEALGDGALSSADPTLPIDETILASSSFLPKESAVYWVPLSEWCMRPASGLCLQRAISRASTTSSARRWLAVAQPTIFLE